MKIDLMVRINKRIWILFSMLLLTLSLQSQSIIVLKGGKIISPGKYKKTLKATVVIRGSKISQIILDDEFNAPNGSKIIDLNGKYIIPGLIDCHAHVTKSLNRAKLASWGITTILNPNCNLELVRNEKLKPSSNDTITRLLSTGPIISTSDMKMFGAFVADSPESAKQIVSELKSSGVDAIKLFYDDLGFIISPVRVIEPGIMKLIIEEAHQHGLRVFVHALKLNEAKEVLKSGADGLLHSVINDYVDDEFISLMKERNAFYVPTLSVFEAESDPSTWGRKQQTYDPISAFNMAYDSLQRPETLQQFRNSFTNTPQLVALLPVIRENLRRVSKAGIPVVMGTDMNAPGVLPYISSIMELFLEEEAGLSNEEVLRSATYDAAKALHLDDKVGAIAPGMNADLIILKTNPLKDLRSLLDSEAVIINGNIIRPRKY